MWKRSIFLCIALALFFTLAACHAPKDEATISQHECAVLGEKLSAYGYRETEKDFTADILFDANNRSSYLLATTDKGYLILKRDTYEFCECGEMNPYRDYMDYKKYYGGIIHYYVESAKADSNSAIFDKYYDIVNGTYCNSIPSELCHNAFDSDVNGDEAIKRDSRVSDGRKHARYCAYSGECEFPLIPPVGMAF